jgi:hypothetical protein
MDGSLTGMGAGKMCLDSPCQSRGWVMRRRPSMESKVEGSWRSPAHGGPLTCADVRAGRAKGVVPAALVQSSPGGAWNSADRTQFENHVTVFRKRNYMKRRVLCVRARPRHWLCFAGSLGNGEPGTGNGERATGRRQCSPVPGSRVPLALGLFRRKRGNGEPGMGNRARQRGPRFLFAFRLALFRRPRSHGRAAFRSHGLPVSRHHGPVGAWSSLAFGLPGRGAATGVFPLWERGVGLG